MKNKLTFLSVMLLSVLFFVVSCKKDNISNPQQSTNSNYSNNIMKRIENFRLQMNENYKSSTLMSLDTAVWNLEALLTNYGGYPDSIGKNFLLMKAHFTLPVDANNMVTNDAVQALYQQMVDTITAQLAGIDENIKFLKFSDVQQDSVVGSTAYLSTNDGYGTGFILGLYEPFDDDWIWGTIGTPPPGPFAGNCSGTDFSSDGSNEIQYRLNHPAVMPYSVGYTDIETDDMTGWDFEGSNGPRLYVGTDPTHCMDINELTDNLINADEIIKTPAPNGLKPAGKSFISVEIIDEVVVSYSNESFLHYYQVTYGIPYFHQEQ